jgi:hypothetical protein
VYTGAAGGAMGGGRKDGHRRGAANPQPCYRQTPANGRFKGLLRSVVALFPAVYCIIVNPQRYTAVSTKTALIFVPIPPFTSSVKQQFAMDGGLRWFA